MDFQLEVCTDLNIEDFSILSQLNLEETNTMLTEQTTHTFSIHINTLQPQVTPPQPPENGNVNNQIVTNNINKFLLEEPPPTSLDQNSPKRKRESSNSEQNLEGRTQVR